MMASSLGQTDSTGLFRFSLPTENIKYLVARHGEDIAFLPPSTYYWGDEAWSKRSVNDEIRWYTFDDRQMYRPGEEDQVKGWIRQIGGRQDGDVNLVGSALSGIVYQVYDPQGNEIGSDRVSVNDLGGFNFLAGKIDEKDFKRRKEISEHLKEKFGDSFDLSKWKYVVENTKGKDGTVRRGFYCIAGGGHQLRRTPISITTRYRKKEDQKIEIINYMNQSIILFDEGMMSVMPLTLKEVSLTEPAKPYPNHEMMPWLNRIQTETVVYYLLPEQRLEV